MMTFESMTDRLAQAARTTHFAAAPHPITLHCKAPQKKYWRNPRPGRDLLAGVDWGLTWCEVWYKIGNGFRRGALPAGLLFEPVVGRPRRLWRGRPGRHTAAIRLFDK